MATASAMVSEVGVLGVCIACVAEVVEIRLSWSGVMNTEVMIG